MLFRMGGNGHLPNYQSYHKFSHSLDAPRLLRAATRPRLGLRFSARPLESYSWRTIIVER